MSAQTEQDIEHIWKLQASAAFNNYYLRRLRERRDALAAEILERDDLSHEERETKRKVWQEYKAIIALPEQDARALKG